jgi:hypothetical protein
MPGTTVFGFQCKGYRDSADNPASPTWVELGEIADLTVNVGFSESDASIRGAGGLELTEPGLLQLEVTGKMEWRNNNTNCNALYTAFLARTAINMWFLTGARTDTNARGFKGDFKITKFPINQELKELTSIDIAFKPCRSSRATPNYVASASGA